MTALINTISSLIESELMEIEVESIHSQMVNYSNSAVYSALSSTYLLTDAAANG